LNLPLRRVTGGGAVAPLVTSGDGVVVEAVKLADDRSGDLVVRLYEALGRRCRARMGAGVALSGVAETDLLERPIATDALRAWDEGGADLALRPFQVVTLRLWRG
jgi:alpha-mannosidase